MDVLKSPEVPGAAPALFVENFDGLFKLVVGAQGYGASAVVRHDIFAATEGNVLAIENIVLDPVKIDRFEVYLDVT